MTDTLIARSIRAEHEARMGVESIEELTARRDALVNENAKREAGYGSTATWKFRRDRLEALIAIEKRKEMAHLPKVTDKMIAEAVLTDPRMERFHDVVDEEKIAYVMAQTAIDTIEKLIERDAQIARHVAAELRLQ
jgi:hypothetical protein